MGICVLGRGSGTLFISSLVGDRTRRQTESEHIQEDTSRIDRELRLRDNKQLGSLSQSQPSIVIHELRLKSLKVELVEKCNRNLGKEASADEEESIFKLNCLLEELFVHGFAFYLIDFKSLGKEDLLLVRSRHHHQLCYQSIR